MTRLLNSLGLDISLRAGRAALQWRLLLLWCLILLLPTAMLCVPVWQLLSTALDHSVHVPRLAQALDMVAIGDLTVVQDKNAQLLQDASLLALILTLLLSPLLSGMVVVAARAQQRPGMRELFSGSLRLYGRMGRMLLWGLLPLGLAFGLGSIATHAAANYGEHAILEADAGNARLAAKLVLLALLIVAHASVDAGRAVLALDRRCGVIKSWWLGCKTMLRRPLAVFGIYALIGLIGLVLAAVLTVARIHLAPADLLSFVAASLLTQLIVAVLAWMRSARLLALVDLSRDLHI